jgi:hypothetical protein
MVLTFLVRTHLFIMANSSTRSFRQFDSAVGDRTPDPSNSNWLRACVSVYASHRLQATIPGQMHDDLLSLPPYTGLRGRLPTDRLLPLTQ